MSDAFSESFTFLDLGNVQVSRPLREMAPVEVLRAWNWHYHEADRICADDAGPPSDEEIALVEKAQRLWKLIEAAMPEWPDGMPVGRAAHQFWPFGRPPS